MGIIILLSVIGYFRGLIGEVLRILVWIGAIFATVYSMTHWLYILPKMDPLIVGGILFLAYLVFFKIIQLSIDHFLKGLSFINQPLGFIFGGLKGCCLIIALSYPLHFLDYRSRVLDYIESEVKPDPRFKQCESYVTTQVCKFLCSLGWSCITVKSFSSDHESTKDTPIVV